MFDLKWKIFLGLTRKRVAAVLDETEFVVSTIKATDVGLIIEVASSVVVAFSLIVATIGFFDVSLIYYLIY